MARAFGLISIVSLMLAIGLVLYSWSPPAAGSLAQALGAPAPQVVATPAACAGLKLTGGHPGCIVLTQITCRPGLQRITVEGLLSSGRRVTAEATPSSFAISFAGPDGNLVLSGGPPKSFDPAGAAEIDTELGLAGSPDRTRAVGVIPCSF